MNETLDNHLGRRELSAWSRTSSSRSHMIFLAEIGAKLWFARYLRSAGIAIRQRCPDPGDTNPNDWAGPCLRSGFDRLYCTGTSASSPALHASAEHPFQRSPTSGELLQRPTSTIT
jgi:hypothetical protein